MTHGASGGQDGHPLPFEQLPRMSGALPFVANAPKVIWEMLRARGNLGEALRRILIRHETLSLRVRLGLLPATVIADPELARELLVSHDKVWKKAEWERRVLFPVMEGGTIILEGEEWKEHRHAIAPTFSASSLTKLSGLVSQAARSRLSNWRGSVNASHEMRCMLNEAITGYFLDGPSGERCPMSMDDLAGRFARIEKGLEDHVVDRWGVSDRLFALFALFSHNLTFDQALADVTCFIHTAIENAATSAGEAPTSTLHTILTRLPAGDSALEEIRTLVAAGMTTVHLLSWLLYLLGEHPQVQEQLRAAASVDAPENSLYVNAVINEGLRLYPPAPFLLRENGKGLLFISIWSMHRHPSLWTEPEAFRPERWLEKGPDGGERLVQSDAFIPFGIGPRVCIGKRFAQIEAATVLKEVLTRFRFTVPVGAAPVAKLAVLTRPSSDIRIETRPLG
jgi:cytochrome P450